MQRSFNFVRENAFPPDLKLYSEHLNSDINFDAAILRAVWAFSRANFFQGEHKHIFTFYVILPNY